MAALNFNKDLYFVTSTVVDWIDVFTRPDYKNIIVESLRYCQENKGLEIYAWVLMSNHLHAIIGTNCEEVIISDILRDFKKYTSKNIIKAIQENPQESRKVWLLDKFGFHGEANKKTRNFKFWQSDNYIETITSFKFYCQKRDYIHANPVKQEIVENPEDYIYSSARNYAGIKGLLNVLIE